MNRMLHTLSLGVRNLWLQKLRSLLTVLGLVFGVASVIAMLAIAEGASAEAQRQIADLGANHIILTSEKPAQDMTNDQASAGDRMLSYGLTHEDLARIVENVPTVADAYATREFAEEVRALDRYLEAQVVGVTPEFFATAHLEPRAGRLLTGTDLDGFANVCVLGAELADQLFPIADPLGRAVRVGGKHYYRVVGVTRRKGDGGSGPGGRSFDRDAYIPLSTNRARFGDVLMREGAGSFSMEKLELSRITVVVDRLDRVEATAAVLDSLVGQYHPQGDYSMLVPLELLKKAEETKRIFNLVLGSIAGISMLVGGIGIMNIMLATVTERTREIGIRRALGARRRDITAQFLAETAVLSGVGGVLGVLLGLAVPPVVERLSGVEAITQPWVPVLSLLIALAVGIGFGVYPARRAALLDPIEALRAE